MTSVNLLLEDALLEIAMIHEERGSIAKSSSYVWKGNRSKTLQYEYMCLKLCFLLFLHSGEHKSCSEYWNNSYIRSLAYKECFVQL